MLPLSRLLLLKVYLRFLSLGWFVPTLGTNDWSQKLIAKYLRHYVNCEFLHLDSWHHPAVKKTCPTPYAAGRDGDQLLELFPTLLHPDFLWRTYYWYLLIAETITRPITCSSGRSNLCGKEIIRCARPHKLDFEISCVSFFVGWNRIWCVFVCLPEKKL